MSLSCVHCAQFPTSPARHHHPSSPVSSTPLPRPPPRTCNPHSPSHHLAHTEPPTTAARLASPIILQPPQPPNPAQAPPPPLPPSRLNLRPHPAPKNSVDAAFTERTRAPSPASRALNFTPHTCSSHRSRSPAWPRWVLHACPSHTMVETLPWKKRHQPYGTAVGGPSNHTSDPVGAPTVSLDRG